jgi:hypothetical protein
MKGQKKYSRSETIALESIAVLSCALLSGCGGDAASAKGDADDESTIASAAVKTAEAPSGGDAPRRPPARIVSDTIEETAKGGCDEDIRMAKPPCNH